MRQWGTGLQGAERAAAGGLDRGRRVVGVPELPRDEDLLPREVGFGEHLREGLPHLVLVLVDGRAVDVAIAAVREREADGFADGAGRGSLPCAEADQRDGRASVKLRLLATGAL